MAAFGRADIYRWDNGERIPGTEGIQPGPGIDQSFWNTNSQDLQYGNFSDGLNLSAAKFYSSSLVHAHFRGANLTNAVLESSALFGANLSGAVVTGAVLSGTTSKGFMLEQLASTASYQARNLQGIELSGNDLADWDFSGQDLTNSFLSSRLTRADLSEANLTNARLFSSTLNEVNLSGAVVTRANFGGTTPRPSRNNGFTESQLASTASYQAKNLQGIGLSFNDLIGWDFSGQNLSNADLNFSSLNQANLSGANLKNANFKSTSIGSAILSSNTIYNQWTVFPTGFDPVTFGLTLIPSTVGDLDANDALGLADIEYLQHRIRGSGLPESPLEWLPQAMFDLNNDRSVSQADINVWVKDLKRTYFGDANVDGEFNSGDLVQVSASGKYDSIAVFDAFGLMRNPATWSTGDWNSDGEFTSSDLILAFQDGGYENGARAAFAVVPEPCSFVLLTVGLLGLSRHRIVR